MLKSVSMMIFKMNNLFNGSFLTVVFYHNITYYLHRGIAGVWFHHV